MHPSSSTPRTLKLTVAYDGTSLVGWQRQAAGDSVQQLLEDALARFEGAPVVVHGAGRTDAGVHALAQVASVRVTFSHDGPTLARALNAQVPAALRVLSVEDVAPGFHARFDARAKTYRYAVRNGPLVSPFERGVVWHVPQHLDLSAMQEAAAILIGTHDFAVFQSVGSEAVGSVRTVFRSTIEAVPPGTLAIGSLRLPDVEAAGRILVYEIHGDGFLRHMVRTIVGTLVEVGRGWRTPASIGDLLAKGARADAGPTAPPHGLVLVGVDYD